MKDLIFTNLVLHMMLSTEITLMIEKKFAECAACRCCVRHRDKPLVWAPYKEYIVPSTPTASSCMCSCRHDARMLCRVHPERTQGAWSGDSAPWMVEVCEILGLPTFTEDLSCDDVSDWYAWDVARDGKREREYDESKEPKKNKLAMEHNY